jgi:type II secretory pathway pseudopilin PulG
MIVRLRRRIQNEDGGFTLIELSVAMFITLLVMGVLGTTFLASISGIALAKQRQQGSALATATMEQFRAIDYATIQSGMTCSDLAGDTRVTLSGGCASGTTGTFAPGIAGISEPLVVQTSGASVAPLLPHRRTQVVENVTYNIAAYVSRPSATSQAFNLTVITTFSSRASKGTRTVIQRSVGFSPSRCLSSATHPYAGACQASFNGDAGLTKGGINLLNATDGVSLIPGFNGTQLSLGLNSLSSTLNSEQVTKLSGLVTTTRVDQLDSSNSSIGGASASTNADNDPASASSGVGTATVSQSSGSLLGLAGSGGILISNPTPSDTGSLDARTASGASTCIDAAGATLSVLNQPCSWGAGRRVGSTSTFKLYFPSPVNFGQNFTIASVAESPTNARSVVSRVGAAGGTACPTTSGAGCVTAQASRSVGTITLGGLPGTSGGDTPPPGWISGNSLINISGLTESGYAEAGPGHRDPSFTRSAGTLTYWDKTTNTFKSLTTFKTLTSDFSADFGTLTGTYKMNSHDVGVQLSGSMRVGSITPVAPAISTPDTTCKTTACNYSATPASTLIATLVYSISIDGAPITSFALTIDLGTVLARVSYKAAFDG